MANSENEEDLKELEVRLYSQVHHEAVDPEPAQETKTSENDECADGKTGEKDSEPPGNANSRLNRYWEVKEKSTVSQHKKFVKSTSGAGGEAQKNSAPSSQSANTSSEKANVAKSVENQKEKTGPGGTPSASGGVPEKKRSINPFSVTPPSKKPGHSKDPVKRPGDASGGFQDRKLRKLELNKKMMQKREKSKAIRLKKKKTAETIVLDSSSDEDVVVIPVPPPPVVYLDSSDEEESFVKPSDPKQASDAQVVSSNSRCNSPNSVMSDDFIGQQDKKRLLSETVVAEDEDMQCEAVEDDQNLNIAEQGEEVMQAENFATPTKRVSRKKSPDEPTYEVTQLNFRAVDVYESESSDMPESIYAKGKRKRQSNVGNSSGSDVEECEIVPKSKRLRKRKASGSCKGSEHSDDSSDSEVVNNSATALPFISRGEAVESCKRKIKKKASSREARNAEDQEFMDKLSDIARGIDNKAVESDEDLESSHSFVEDITARDIAEDVLKQSGETADAPESEKAIPSEVIENFDLLNVIDKLCTKIDDYVEPPRHGGVRAEFPEVEVVEEPSESKVEDCIIVDDKPKELEMHITPKKRRNKLDFMNVVYTNRDHVLWNEEMVRFYEFSWGQERFNVDQILRLMDRNSNWRIINSDRFSRGKKFRNMKCNNCCEWGHRLVDCPMPRKDIVCYVCGDLGHKEPRCPNTLCLRCGRKTNVFTRTCQDCISENTIICPICKIRGHSLETCPDKWRRYHSTTTINEHLNSVVHYSEKKHCCICAGRGHLPEHCKSSNKMNEYHAPTTEIRYHAKTYEDVDVKEPLAPGVIGVHLMSAPDINVTFPSLKQVTKDQYYGRFLGAVGLFDSPESKIVRSFVINPFAKESGLVDKQERKWPRRRQFNTNSDDIQLNVSGVVEIDDETGSDVIAEDSEYAENPESIYTKKSKSNQAVTIDDDSNYSFSDHFPDKDKSEGDSETVIRINRKKSVGPLPDFIPLFNDSLPKVSVKKPEKLGPLPDFIALNDSDDDESKNNQAKEVDEICEGKIYLSKFHSQYLLSPPGTAYLMGASERHNVKVSMEWTAVGNVLVIEGTPANQDSFHAELMEKMKAQSEDKSRNNLEQSQKLPRSREVLIKFLQENILNLEKDLGSVHDLYKKMKYNESNYGKTSFKSAEKNRRLLNMILMGQGGLRDGPMHLSMLQDKLRDLQVEMKTEQVPEEFREELEKHFRYIFSSFKHNNYDQLIRQYTTLKRLNQLPTLGLDYKLLGKKVLDTQFTKEQKAKLHSPEEAKPGSNFADISDAVKFKAPRTEFGMSPQKDNDREDEEQSQQQIQYQNQPHPNHQQYQNQPHLQQQQPRNLQQQHPHQQHPRQQHPRQQYPRQQHPQQQYPRQQHPQQQHPRQQHPRQQHPQQQNLQWQQHPQQQNPQRQQRQQDPRQQRQQDPRQQRQKDPRQQHPHPFLPEPHPQQNPHQQQQHFQHRQQHQRYQPYHQRNQQQSPMRPNYQQQQTSNTTPFHQKQFKNSPNNQRSQHFQGSNFNGGGQGRRGSFTPNKAREAHKKWDSRIQNINQSTTPTKMDAKQDKSASQYWSKESVKYIARCMSLSNLQSNIHEKLVNLSDRASNNLLSYYDFKSIKKIYFNLLKANNAQT